jgi:hypothetical protein
MAVHKHHGGGVRRSPAPRSAATNSFTNGTHGVSPALSVGSDMSQPGGGPLPVGGGPALPTLPSSTALPPGAPPMCRGKRNGKRSWRYPSRAEGRGSQIHPCGFDEVAWAFRDDVARAYEMMSPGRGASLA